MPKFVILEHQREGEKTHWDLMLEQGDVLTTFRLDTPPELITLGKTKATPIFDHERRFLTYEGPVNNEKGSVRRVDAGRYATLIRGDNRWAISLEGNALAGCFELTQIGKHAGELSFTPA